MSARPTQGEVDELAKVLVDFCLLDSYVRKSQDLSAEEHSNKVLTSILTAYALISATRRDPQELIDDATKFFNQKKTRDRMARMRTTTKVLEF